MTRAPRFGALLVLLVGCREPDPPLSSAPPKTSARKEAASVAASTPAPPPPRKHATCRALGVEGKARVGERALGSGMELDGSAWVTLEAGASLTLKHATSGREVAVSGPALFRACEHGREQVLLVRGTLRVGSGMGSRPGAEVLLATPIASARYADADFTLALDAQRLTLDVRAGRVELEPADVPAPKGSKSPLHAKDKLSLPLGKPDPERLLSRCKEAAEAAEATARNVRDRGAEEPLGERARAHVRARRAARSACAVAAAATGLVADPIARAGLWAEVSRWEGRGAAVPHAAPAAPPEK